MKFMLMMLATQKDWGGFASMAPEEIAAHIRFMHDINRELAASGELVDARGLDMPAQAKRVHADDGRPVVTDGPFAESKEFLAGFWIVECTAARAYEIAARISAAPGRGGVPLNFPLEVRQVMKAPEPA
jgi:hypothetical protein